MYLKPKDTKIIGMAFLFICCLNIVSWLLWGNIVLVIFLSLMMGVIVLIQMDNHRSIQMDFKQQDYHYKQVEALFSLFSMIRPRYPLPSMDGWAITPDFANILISHIREHKPRVILELSSGTSTLIAAYIVEEIGVGSIYSLENTEEWTASTVELLKKHGLQELAEVIHAPLETIMFGEESWLWYDRQQIPDLTSIDLLVVDGPPKRLQNLSRYPALPVLFDKLSDNAVILLDDSKREDETKTVERWLVEYPELQCEMVDTEKGTAILRKSGHRA